MTTRSSQSLPPSPQDAKAKPRRLAWDLSGALNSTTQLVSAVSVMAILLAAASFPRSAFFPIRAILVDGGSHVSAAAIVASTGLRVGDRYFGVPTGEVADRLGRHPWIAAAQVRLEPRGIVRIVVNERSPYAILAVDGKHYAIDRDGVVLERRAPADDLPLLINGLKGTARPQLGAPMPSVEARAALAVLQDLPAVLVGPRAQMTVAPNGDLTFITEDRIGVLLGQSPGLRERVALLVPLLNAIRAQPNAIAYVDLRFSGNIVVKPSTGGKGSLGAGVHP